MTLNILYWAKPSEWPAYKAALTTEFNKHEMDVDLFTETDNPAAVDYIIYAPQGAADNLTPFTNTRLIQSLWAGPDKLIANPTLTQPLARMVDAGMAEGMIDYVLGNVLRHHLHTDVYSAAKPGDWRSDLAPPLARNRTLGFLGIGALGMACARAVHQHGFNVMGWSRSAKTDADIACYHGDSGLNKVLSAGDIIVLLMPHTPQTENLINAKTLAKMKPSASIINPGRGHLIDDDALLAALDSGHISQATLDVFRIEPLPTDHRYWTHPNVLVTPHIASETRVETSAEVAAENIHRAEAGDDVLYLVDRKLNY